MSTTCRIDESVTFTRFSIDPRAGSIITVAAVFTTSRRRSASRGTYIVRDGSTDPPHYVIYEDA